ncbi:hypothetical protein L7F22_046867 [Adiantum nelumboides]|nr:hypothetical protein [Adiantum nelumboides]
MLIGMFSRAKYRETCFGCGRLKDDVVLGTALVDMYAKCGVLQKAQKVLEELPFRNVVSWNVLIAGYLKEGQDQEALGYLQQMQNEGLDPNAITYDCILKACGIMQDCNHLCLHLEDL